VKDALMQMVEDPRALARNSPTRETLSGAEPIIRAGAGAGDVGGQDRNVPVRLTWASVFSED